MNSLHTHLRKTVQYIHLQGSALPLQGLQSGANRHAVLSGQLRQLACSAPTIGQALIAVIRYLRNCNPVIHYRLENRPGQSLLLFYNAIPANAETPWHIERAIFAVRLLISELRGAAFRPRAVSFRHAPLGNAAGYQRQFDCPVAFGQEQDSLMLAAEVLQETCVANDAEAHALLRFYLEAQHEAPDNLHAQVKRKIQMLLPQQRCTLALVAEALALHPRTLQRRLAQEEMDFEAYVDAIRRDQALHLLRKTSLSVGQIASELGYRRTTSFCRAHQRWFDMTPLAHRRTFGDSLIAAVHCEERQAQ